MENVLQEKAQELFSRIGMLCEAGLNRDGDLCEDRFEIAEKSIHVKYPNAFLKEYFRWQMNLFRIPFQGSPDAEVRIWSDNCMDELFPFMESNSCSLQLFDGDESVDVYLGNGPRAGRNLFAWKESTKEGWVVIPPDSLKQFIGVSHSLSPLMSRMNRFFDARMLHCASVVLDGQAILISGVSGSGKSTLAASCLNYGIDYLSDDTILYRAEDNRVFPISSTLHISKNVLEHLPRLNQLVTSGEMKTYPGRASKNNLDLTPLKQSFVNGAEASLMLCPKICTDEEARFERIENRQVLVPLILSSVKLLGYHEYAAKYMKGITERLKELPFYRYWVVPNLERNASNLVSMIRSNQIEFNYMK